MGDCPNRDNPTTQRGGKDKGGGKDKASTDYTKPCFYHLCSLCRFQAEPGKCWRPHVQIGSLSPTHANEFQRWKETGYAKVAAAVKAGRPAPALATPTTPLLQSSGDVNGDPS